MITRLSDSDLNELKKYGRVEAGNRRVILYILEQDALSALSNIIGATSLENVKLSDIKLSGRYAELYFRYI